jgi:hypothetical protein
MDSRLVTPFLILRIGLGLTATLAGLDKFTNILADWGGYVSPLAVRMLPFSVVRRNRKHNPLDPNFAA